MVARYENTTHGQLTALRRAGVNPEGRALWLCLCTCGNAVEATTKQLTKKHVTACPECQDSGSKSILSVRLRKYTVSPSGCWNWTGKQNTEGYGVLMVEGKYTRAHRAAYFTANPDADRSKVVMHKCDNPSCINLEHLRLGTQEENMRDMAQKGRSKGGAPLGNKNALGNKGWTLGGVTAKYASKVGQDFSDRLLKAIP